jgi:hypothetical protein
MAATEYRAMETAAVVRPWEVQLETARLDANKRVAAERQRADDLLAAAHDNANDLVAAALARAGQQQAATAEEL